MPPELVSSDSTTQKPGFTSAIPAQWRGTLATLACAIAALIAVSAREWGEMLHQWWNIDTYNHILLVPLIIMWLVWLKAEELAKMTPKAYLPALALVAAGLALWFAGRMTGLNLIAHAGAVGAVQGALVAILGLRISAFLALPIAYAAFLVPFGDEMIPALQAITAQIAIALTVWSGVSAVIDGIFIDTPVGLFIVAEACSGVKFLIAMVTLGVLVCFTRFQNWKRRALFMAAAIIIPIIANGIRAWGTIFIAQSAGVEFAAGFDHIFYGWIFFALVVIIVLAGAWRFFESEPEDYGPSAKWVEENSLIARYEGGGESASTALGVVIALSLAAGIGAAILAPSALT